VAVRAGVQADGAEDTRDQFQDVGWGVPFARLARIVHAHVPVGGLRGPLLRLCRGQPALDARFSVGADERGIAGFCRRPVIVFDAHAVALRPSRDEPVIVALDQVGRLDAIHAKQLVMQRVGVELDPVAAVPDTRRDQLAGDLDGPIARAVVGAARQGQRVLIEASAQLVGDGGRDEVRSGRLRFGGFAGRALLEAVDNVGEVVFARAVCIDVLLDAAGVDHGVEGGVEGLPLDAAGAGDAGCVAVELAARQRGVLLAQRVDDELAGDVDLALGGRGGRRGARLAVFAHHALGELNCCICNSCGFHVPQGCYFVDAQLLADRPIAQAFFA